MERRPYFVLGDLAVNCATGGVTAWLASSVVPTGWGMAGGMVAGMILGMVIGIVLAFVFTPLFGALEVMLPAMLSGMLAGMGGGMMATQVGPMAFAPWQAGVAVGALSMAYSYFVQFRLGSELAQ